MVQLQDYQATILPLMLEQFKKSPKLNAIVSAFNEEATQLETALIEVRDLFYLNPPPASGMIPAVGVQLDIIGKVFGVFRNGLPDDLYRAQILRKAALRFSGTPNDILTAIIAFFGGTYANYVPNYPAGFTIDTDAVLNNDLVELLAPAGVGFGTGGHLIDGAVPANDIVQADGSLIYIYTTPT